MCPFGLKVQKRKGPGPHSTRKYKLKIVCTNYTRKYKKVKPYFLLGYNNEELGIFSIERIVKPKVKRETKTLYLMKLCITGSFISSYIHTKILTDD